MRKKRVSAMKNIAVLSCVFISLLCIILKIQSTSPEASADFLFYTAGFYAGDDGKTNVQKTENKDSADFHHDANMIEKGDVVPYKQIDPPKKSEPTDSNKENLPVQEIVAGGGDPVDNFFVKDSTESGTNLAQELLQDPAIKLKADGTPEVLLYHTHTSEAYSSEYTGFYNANMETRTQNQDMSVVAVGDAIKAELEKYGIGVIHDKSVNDLSFNGSYARSWEVLQRNLEEHPTIQVTLDIHRDSMTTDAGVKYKPTVEVGGKKAAQVMFLAGCDFNGGWGDFPDWIDNLHMALRVQQKAMQLYPDLMRPLMFSNSKYNMNATKGSMLIEVGTEVNTAEEARYSGKLIGEVLGKTLMDYRE